MRTTQRAKAERRSPTGAERSRGRAARVRTPYRGSLES
ncbi:hypothetical protein D187_008304 [Cystobacter fuscus DSM 2262]|uniref:Uncharacterized protein n=1 Tax=Cystobacter fuscus (strain ATCC 25194 / DSM 2262 / NBRC 100088 / M29) TaxID=1242864 RepID=S9QH61_CYSF2|nr:hypothetical protein D187_008304 [Cystobacter fuscus DSM 2262]